MGRHRDKRYGRPEQHGFHFIPGTDRYSINSAIEAYKRALEKELGPLRSGDAWTSEGIGWLWNGFFLGWIYRNPNPTIPTFHSVLRRSPDAVGTMRRKSSIRHEDCLDRLNFSCRIDRRGSPYIAQDFYVFHKAMSEVGMMNNAHLFSHIANLQARDVEEVAVKYQEIEKECARQGFFPEKRGMMDPPVPGQVLDDVRVYLLIEIRGSVYLTNLAREIEKTND